VTPRPGVPGADASTAIDGGSSPNPGAPGTVAIPTFAQGLFRGEDPRVRFVNGFYYSVLTEGSVRKLYKSKSLVDRGAGKVVPTVNGAAFPLFAPIFIHALNGQTYDAWFAFDGNEWECDCADPYDDLAKWHVVKSIPFTGWSIDFEIFQNPDPGPYQGRSYLVWAGADSPSTAWGFESAFVAELLDLRAGQRTLSTYDNTDANRVAKYAFDWTDVIVEAPAPAIHGTTVSIVYSGNGAETDDYALGVSILRRGADPSRGASYIDHNHGQCDGDVKNGPELSRTAGVLGPGVARFTKSADGSQDWMLYHAKVFDTFNRGSGTPGQQDNNEMWTRLVDAAPVAWRDVVCSGEAYSIPRMGVPVDAGTAMASPSGDPGLTTGTRRIEAEAMIPFGFVMGGAVQGIARVGGNPEVLVARSASASNGEKVTHLDALAADVMTAPKRSGLVWRNAVGGASLTIASASVATASLDLYVNGNFTKTLVLPATGGADSFRATRFAVTIPLGAEIRLVYEQGKSAPADLDFIEVAP
jgi:GH43 family beta-xylosidase